MEKIKGHKLEITVFICGVMSMVLELVAARVLSPYVGSSNLIWTTIIGIMLTCMSLGYWLGGKVADKVQDAKDLSQFIWIAAFTTSLIPIFETIIVNRLANILNQQLIIVAMISATFLFGIPSFMLATASPIAVKLKHNEQKQIGIVSGKISSLSTIGSIFGTFFAGFVLIPSMGVSNIILGSSIILLSIAIAIHPNKTPKYIMWSLATAIIIVLCVALGKYLFKNVHPDVIRDEDSEYSRIWVKNVEVAQNSNYKTLQVDTGLESYMNEETGEMGAKYLTYYDLFSYFNKNAKSTLMIGGAAYTYPKHYLKKYQDNTIDVVEIDPKMTQIAQEEFNLDTENTHLAIYHQDGRSYLNYSHKTYDTILIDAFKGLNAPFELTTYEAMKKAEERLNENGTVITNVISALEGSNATFIEHEYVTYKAVFDAVKLYRVQPAASKTQLQNIILVGIKGNPENNEDLVEEYEEILQTEIQDYTTNTTISTDDYAPIGS